MPSNWGILAGMTHIDTAEAMQEFGMRVGQSLQGGEVIELIGDVGAGKTTFVKGLARGMDIDESVQSPSFTISRVYDAANGQRLVHYDFYRLQDAGIMAAELDDVLNDKTAVVVVEWAEAVAHVLPDDRLTMTITPDSQDGRELSLLAGGVTSTALKEAIV